MDEVKVGKISIPVIKGDRGEKGEIGSPGRDGTNGYSPVKGLDYFTDDEIDEITRNAAQQSADIVTNDINNKIEQDLTDYYKKNDLSNFYNKTEVDQELEKRDTKIANLENQVGDITIVLDIINGEVI